MTIQEAIMTEKNFRRPKHVPQQTWFFVSPFGKILRETLENGVSEMSEASFTAEGLTATDWDVKE